MDSILYIGTDKGVFTARSRDSQAWEVVNHGLKAWDICELAQAPDAPNKVYAGTRGDGLWVSEDFGKSWKKPSYGKRGPGKVRSVTVDPHDPRRIYVGAEPIDIYVSEDAGKSWDRFDSLWDLPSIATIPYPVAAIEPHVRDVTVDPSNPDILYAALQVGYIAKSTDRGKSWKILNKDLDCDVHTIVIDPVDPRHLLVATGGHDSRHGTVKGRALYDSPDGGENWTPIAMNLTHNYSVPLTHDPRNPKQVYSAVAHGQPPLWGRRASGAEATLIRSSDGGRTWSSVAQGFESADFTDAIVVDDAIPGLVYTACRSGKAYASQDAGETWQALGFQLNVEDVSTMTLAHA